MPVDDDAAQKALDRLIAIAAPSSAKVSEEMAHEVQRMARANLEDPLGPLAESIMVTGPDLIGKAAYRSQTGPTLEYGRQRELGGHIYPREKDVLTAAFRAPGYWTWDYGDGLGERDVFTHEVYQVGQHYLKRGVEISMPELMRIATKIWGDAIRTAT